MTTDTIVAQATPPGEGGISIVRVSGPGAEVLLAQFFSKAAQHRLTSHRLYRGFFQDLSGAIVDEVMVVVMRAPRSFTREDVVEVHCHGGPVIVHSIVDAFLDGGARMARPGEFTLRAFLNGRLDLTQAEAVIDVIRSRSEAAERLAQSQLHGHLGIVLGRFRESLLQQLAEVETHIDFAEEDISLPDLSDVSFVVSGLVEEVSGLLDTYENGRCLHEGARVLILGKPNVGKSSLLNLLLGESRAIVTDIPGTTRDTLEEPFVLSGLPLQLIDTAGIRHTSDPVEMIGVQRAKDKIAGADLVLLVVDGSFPPDPDDVDCLSMCPPDRTVVVLNKADLEQVCPSSFAPGLPRVPLSAKHAFGLDDLVVAIKSRLGFDSRISGEVESVILYKRRHREALLVARNALVAFLGGVESRLPAELLALELRSALDAIGQVTGDAAPDEVLESIFSRFCIGK